MNAPVTKRINHFYVYNISKVRYMYSGKDREVEWKYIQSLRLFLYKNHLWTFSMNCIYAIHSNMYRRQWGIVGYYMLNVDKL